MGRAIQPREKSYRGHNVHWTPQPWVLHPFSVVFVGRRRGEEEGQRWSHLPVTALSTQKRVRHLMQKRSQSAEYSAHRRRESAILHMQKRSQSAEKFHCSFLSEYIVNIQLYRSIYFFIFLSVKLPFLLLAEFDDALFAFLPLLGWRMVHRLSGSTVHLCKPNWSTLLPSYINYLCTADSESAGDNFFMGAKHFFNHFEGLF